MVDGAVIINLVGKVNIVINKIQICYAYDK